MTTNRENPGQSPRASLEQEIQSQSERGWISEPARKRLKLSGKKQEGTRTWLKANKKRHEMAEELASTEVSEAEIRAALEVEDSEKGLLKLEYQYARLLAGKVDEKLSALIESGVFQEGTSIDMLKKQLQDITGYEPKEQIRFLKDYLTMFDQAEEALNEGYFTSEELTQWAFMTPHFILKKVKDYKKKQAAAAENQDADIAMADNLLDEL